MSKIIKLEGTFNTRDIGGIVNTEGKKVRTGLMIRSDALNTLTPKDIAYFENIKLKTIVDFRGKKEIEKAPDVNIAGVQTIPLSPNAEVAAMASGNIVDDKKKIDVLLKEASTKEGQKRLQKRMDEMVVQMRELVNTPYANQQYSKFLDILIDADNLPLLHHCRGGKDRTGFATMITLFALDVSIEEVKKDYMLTKDCMTNRNEKRMDEYRTYTDNPIVLEYLSGLMSTKEIYFDAAIEEMIKLAGSIDMYLESYLLLTKEKKEKMKSIFLES